MNKRALLAAVAALSLSGAAYAQEEARQVFEPAYFERFAPQTALDMVERVPGFSIREQGDDRGLGQGGVNVLINGDRVTSKDTDATDVLGRTPADTVVRIEVADAATLGVTGLTGQVANVVIDRSSLSGNWEYEPQFRDGALPRWSNGTVGVSGEAKDLSYTLGFDNRSFRGGEQGPELVFDGDGNFVERRQEKFSSQGENPTLTASLNYPISDRTSLAFTGTAALFTVDRRERSVVVDSLSRLSKRDEDEWNAEGSLELTHEVGPGALKVIAYDRFERSVFSNELDFDFADGSSLVSAFDQSQNEGELIGRTEYAFTTNSGVTWEIAGEVAFNFLDSESSLAINDGLTNTVSVDPNTRVEELREEISLTRGFTIFGDLAVQSSLAAEWSRITVIEDESSEIPNVPGASFDIATGGPTQSQSFTRPKGFVSFAYPLTDRFDVRARFERSVGQLPFTDFVSSVNQQENREREGNADLVQEQSWDGEIELEAAISENEKVIFRVSGNLIEDLIDQVPIAVLDDLGQPVLDDDNNPEFVDGVGNLDSAKRWEVALEGTLETDRWGVPGGRLDFFGTYRDTNVEDPVTFDKRSFSRISDWYYEVEFRHDIPSTPYAWGMSVESFEDVVVYRIDEIAIANIPNPEASAFVEHKDVFGMLLRLSVDNLFDVQYEQDRTRWEGLRNQSDIEFIEDRVRTDGRRFSLTLSGTF